MEFIFKNLIVWKKAMELTKLVYGLVRRFPAEERYALADQLRRAVASIPSNIAEGNGRAGNKDYAHFLAIARGSLYEVVTQLEIAQGLGYIDNYDEVLPLAEEVAPYVRINARKYGTLEPKSNVCCSPSP